MDANDYRRERNGTGSVLVSLERVCKRWGDRVVLDGVDLEMRAGAIIGVAGANGTGKTTLLRIAAGIIMAQEGSTHFRGVDIEDDLAAYQQAIGVLSAGDGGLYARLTVRQNLDFWAGLTGLQRRERRSRISELLPEFEIVELADRRVDRLSMGQRQRVRLAMTFLHQPTVVFLDEPKTSLDGAGVSVLRAAIARLVARGGVALWASPEPDEPFLTESWILQEGQLHPFVPEGVAPDETEVPHDTAVTAGAFQA